MTSKDSHDNHNGNPQGAAKPIPNLPPHNNEAAAAATAEANLAAANKQHAEEIAAIKEKASLDVATATKSDLQALEEKESAIVKAVVDALATFNAAMVSAFTAGIVVHVGLGPSTAGTTASPVATAVKLISVEKTVTYAF